MARVPASLGVLVVYSVPEPCEDDGGGFSQTGGDGDESGFAGVGGETLLIGVRFAVVAEGGGEEGAEV